MDKPVPSLPLYKLKYENNSWKYIYCFETPVTLTDKKRKTPLYLMGLRSMKLSDQEIDMMINIEVFCKDDIYKLLKQQRKSDMHYRKIFKENNDMSNYQERTFKVKNKSQSAIGKMVVKIRHKSETETVFVGRG